MSINKTIIVTATLGIALGVSSCKKFLDVNKNPNISQAATVQTLLPAAELYVGTAVGVDLEIDGSFWAQYWTESPNATQYRILDTYNPGQDQFSTPWTNLYAANENFYQLYQLADSLKNKQYMAIALLMQAYTYQLITDAWGDVPFTQALKGQYANGHIVNPKYDSQMVVYNGILAYIDSANKLINVSDPIQPTNDDLIFGTATAAYAANGNAPGSVMTGWQKFSNTLKLKVLMRLSTNPLTQATAQAGIDSLFANPVTNVFIGSTPGDDAVISNYGTNTGNENPLYSEATGLGLGAQNLVASTSCLDTMVSNNDPRLNVFFIVAPATGAFAGIPQGAAGSFTSGTWSIPSQYVGGNNGTSASGSAPVNLITGYESLFLQAEVAAHGWATIAGTDQTLWENAIAANFNYYNVALTATTGASGASNYTAYMASGANWTLYPAGGTFAQKQAYIITQKYFAMCGNQGFEAWTEWRRTTFPTFVTTTPSTYPGASSLPKPRRFLYPTSESTVNGSFPGLAPIASPVWWDIN